MVFKIPKRFFVIILIIFISVLIIYFLFFFRSEETIFFSNSISKLEIKEVNLLQKILNKKETNLGKLIIDSKPEGVNILIKAVASTSPLVFKDNFSMSFISPREINLNKGIYWLSASKLKHGYFSAVFEIKPLKENKFNIILEPLEEDQTEGAPEKDEIIEEFNQKVESYYYRHPFARFLPYKTNHFKIYLPTDDDVYRVELYPTVNFLLENELYKKQIVDYKKEVYDWIESKGQDPDQLKLKFWPEG
ncbi:MAG: hypothetical protein AB1465_02630 [Patescibacteria group bacterium]